MLIFNANPLFLLSSSLVLSSSIFLVVLTLKLGLASPVLVLLVRLRLVNLG